jgi:hypothetical protein
MVADYRKDKSAKARAHAVNNFSEPAIVEQILSMYEQVHKGAVRFI